MIHRKFDKLKFRRTYIGGSKQRELEIFTCVQGTKEDNSECDWFEYRRHLMQYCDDVLNIILTWRMILNVLRYGFIVLAVMLSFVNPLYSIPAIVFSVVTLILFHLQRNKETRTLAQYGFSLDVINQQTGVDLPKN